MKDMLLVPYSHLSIIVIYHGRIMEVRVGTLTFYGVERWNR